MVDAMVASVAILFVCWAAFLMDEFLGFHLKRYGLMPRSIEGLRGIFTMHFLHGDWKHIAHNSLGFFVLNSFLFYFYRSIALRTLAFIVLVGPLILWIIGRPSNHIGLSLAIYGEFAFLLLSGFIRRDMQMLRVALVVTVYYGSLVWYLFPVDQTISWEGHLGGFIAGIIIAVWLRKKGPQRVPYRFELEPELPDDENAYWKIPPPEAPAPEPKAEKHDTTITVKYHYVEKDQQQKSPQ